jgi:hypothetical protein
MNAPFGTTTVTLLHREDEVEEVIDHARYIKPGVQPGTLVRLYSSDWVVTLTQAGIDCDCGKGVLCPLNPQTKIGA